MAIATAFEFPRQPRGNTKEDILQLYEDLWRTVEQLRLLEERLNEEISKKK